MNIINFANVAAFTTKDGSEIRELLTHRNSCIQKQSLAEARLPPGASTTPHYHPKTEEIYYILEGIGRITIDTEVRDVTPGDAIAIPPGTIHTIANSGLETLRFLCCCAPGYEHADTVLVAKTYSLTAHRKTTLKSPSERISDAPNTPRAVPAAA